MITMAFGTWGLTYHGILLHRVAQQARPIGKEWR